VNNRVQIALPRLPDDVKRTGVVVQKRSLDILLFVAVTSTDPRFDTLYLSNFMTINALDVLKRVPGVADATIFGARDYSMRIWLRPDKMAQLGVTATDVANAIRAQSNQYAAGKIGQDPAPDDQALIYTVTAQGRLVQPEEFGNIVLRASGPGGVLRLKDIARLELGAISYDAYTTVDGRPTIGTAVFLQSGANALNVANSVRRTMDEIAKGFPAGVSYIIPFDTTRFVQASIKEVIHTLFIAALLVLAVVFVFLQSWRATLIPFIAVPISLVGAFAGLYAFGFSINTLTLFGLVLAIGIVVDDAIVVQRRAADGREGPLPQGGGDRVHARGDRRHHRNRAGAVLGVRPGGLSRRPCRPALPAVRRPRRHGGGHFRRGRADADARLVRAAAQAFSWGIADFQAFQPGFRVDRVHVYERVRWVAKRRDRTGDLRAGHRLHRMAAQGRSRQPGPAGRPGLPVRSGRPAGRGNTLAHRQGRRGDTEGPDGAPGGRARVPDQRLRPDRRRQQDQLGDALHHPEALGRAPRKRGRHRQVRRRARLERE
jgi:hypothetical protein